MNNTLLFNGIMNKQNDNIELYNYFTNYKIDNNNFDKKYAIESFELLISGEKELNIVDKAFEAFNNDCSLINKFTNTEIEIFDLNNKIFGQEDNENNQPNIFIRIWRKFVEAIKKIFGAIIRFFKFIINKIVQFVKWLINKLFKKKRSKEEVQDAVSLFNRFKGLSFKDITKSEESVNINSLFSTEILEDISVCYYNNETFMKLERTIQVTDGFIESANKIINDQIKLQQILTFSDDTNKQHRITDIHQKDNFSGKKDFENTDTLLSRVVRDYIGRINQLSAFPVYKELMNNKNADTRINGKLIAQVCLCKSNIQSYKQLEKLKSSSNITCPEDFISA